MDLRSDGCLKVFNLAPILNFLCTILTKKTPALHTSSYMKFAHFQASLLPHGIMQIVRNLFHVWDSLHPWSCSHWPQFLVCVLPVF